MAKTAAEYQVSEVQAQVRAAATAARDALRDYEPEIRTLAIKQLSVDSDLYAVAISKLAGHAPAAAAASASPAFSPDQLHTMQEIADRCHVSRDAVAKWTGSGELKKTKAGGRALIRESDYQDFLHRSTGRARRSAAA